MPSSLTREQVTAVAALANLDLDPAEIDLFARQLGAILEYAEQVQQVDTSGVPPTTAVVTRHTADRADDAAPCLDTDAALSNAPDSARSNDGGGFFKVPRVIG